MIDNHRHRNHIARMIQAVALLIMALSFLLVAIWLVTAHQNTKLYESDNVVCASQPLAMHCWERHTNP